MMITVYTTHGQNLIGMGAKEIKKYMSSNKSEMMLEKVSNKSYNYLKYSDRNEDQTMLFFLSPDSVCRNIRIVCNNSMKSIKIKELDSVYRRNGDNSWIDTRAGKNYMVMLKEDNWTFSIIIEPEK